MVNIGITPFAVTTFGFKSVLNHPRLPLLACKRDGAVLGGIMFGIKCN